MSKSSEPAFPFVYVDHTDVVYSGITQREYFAAMAMQGMLSHQNIHLKKMSEIASDAVMLSDKLLKELEKPQSNG